MVEGTREACPPSLDSPTDVICSAVTTAFTTVTAVTATTSGVSCSLSVKTSTRAPPLEMSNMCGKSPPTLVCLALGLTRVAVGIAHCVGGDRISATSNHGIERNLQQAGHCLVSIAVCCRVYNPRSSSGGSAGLVAICRHCRCSDSRPYTCHLSPRCRRRL